MTNTVLILGALLIIAVLIYICFFTGYYSRTDSIWDVEQDETISKALDARDELDAMLGTHGPVYLVDQLRAAGVTASA